MITNNKEDIETDICNECFDCKWYVGNSDSSDKCYGSEEKCHEYIESMWSFKNMEYCR